MSYYTFYKFKEDSEYNNQEYFDKQLRRIDDGKQIHIYEVESCITLQIIQWYNMSELPSIEKMLSTIVNRLRLLKLYYNDDMIQCILQSINEDKDHEYVINHALSSCVVENEIQDSDKILYRLATSLVSLALIKFKKEDEYSDSPRCTFDWLMYDIKTYVDGILEDWKDHCYTVSKYEFLNENCDSEDEGQRYKDEIFINNADGE